MALLKLSGIASKISGKLGGSVFGTSSNGSYVKQNSFSQQPNSPGQSIQRNKIIQASQKWRATTTAQKALWQAESPNYPYINRVGDNVFYNGFQIFQFLNQNNFQNNDPILLTPPVFNAVVNANWLISFNPSNVLVVGNTTNLINTITRIFTAPPMRSGVTPKASTYQLLMKHVNTGAAQTFGIQTEFQAKYRTIQVGDFIWAIFKTSVSNNGNTTEFTSALFTEKF